MSLLEENGGGETARRKIVNLYLTTERQNKLERYCKQQKCVLPDGRPNLGRAITEILDKVELVEAIKQANRAEVRKETYLRIVQ